MSFFNDPSKIDPNGKYSISKLTEFIRRGQDGHSVREAIAMGIDDIDLETGSNIKELSDFTKYTEERQSDLEERWDNVLRETTDKDPISAPELIEARNGKTNLKTRLDDDYDSITAQWAQTKHYKTMANELIRPVITFLDDDTKRAVYSRLKNIFESRGVTTGISAVPIQIQANNPDYITQSQLLELYNNGHEILGHGYREIKTVDADLTYAELDYEIGGGNKGYFDSLGIKMNGHVYPGGQSDEKSRSVTRKYFDFAYGGLGIEDGSEVLDTMKIKRIAFGSYTNNNPTINGNDQKNTLAYYKACVDYAIETNGWLTFMTHIQAQPTSDDQVLGDLIDYIKSKGVDILNPSDAYKIHGNRYFAGDVDSGTFTVISKKGILENEGGLTINKLKANEKLLSDTIRTYPKNSITYMFQSAHASLPENTPGFIVTYRLRDNPSQDQETFNFREFWPRGSNKKYISRVLPDNQGNQWGAWEQKYDDGVKTKKVVIQDPKVPAGGSATLPITVEGVTPLETYLTANAAYGLPKDILYNVFVSNKNEVGIRFFNLGDTDHTAQGERTWLFTYR